MATGFRKFAGLIGLVFTFALLAFAGRGAQAASPQILGLVATLEPTPLTCTDGICSAEFSAFCLQKHRAAPMPNTAYAVAPGTELTLRITANDGTARDIDAVSHVTVTSERIFASVRISLPEAELRSLGASGAALSVGGSASVVPVPVAGDDNPITVAEVAQFTGPLRDRAEHYVESDGEGAVTARIANRLVNANYPPDYRATIDTDALWEKAIGAQPGTDAHPGIKRAAAELETCARNYSANGGLVSECMSGFHDTLMSETTKRIWNGLTPGS